MPQDSEAVIVYEHTWIVYSGPDPRSRFSVACREGHTAEIVLELSRVGIEDTAMAVPFDKEDGPALIKAIREAVKFLNSFNGVAKDGLEEQTPKAHEVQ